MEIILNDHAKERAGERGASKEEICDTIRSGAPVIAKENRFAKEKFLISMKSVTESFTKTST